MDFEILKQEIEHATKKAFTEIAQQDGDGEIYAFALYSDEGAMTVCPSANTVQHLETADPEELNYYRFEPAEWKYEMIGADQEFDDISAQLREEVEQMDSPGNGEHRFSAFQRQLYEACIGVLEKLKNEGFFKAITGKDIFLTFTVSDYEFDKQSLRRIIERLNDNEYRTAYLDWMHTWGQEPNTQ